MKNQNLAKASPLSLLVEILDWLLAPLIILWPLSVVVTFWIANAIYLAFVLSAAMAGVAGALYVPQVGIINPSEFSPANSIEAVIWVAVGGRGTPTARSPTR